MTAQNRAPAGIPAGGQFRHADRPDAAASLTPAAAREFTGASGLTHRVRDGVLDSNAQDALTDGQCVALAVEVAERMGVDEIMTWWRDDEDRLIHAAVISPGGVLIDGDIPAVATTADEYEAWLNSRYGHHEWTACEHTIEQARALAESGDVPAPQWEWVRSVADDVVRAVPPTTMS